MKLNHPTALPAEAPVAVPGRGEPPARTRGDRPSSPLVTGPRHARRG